MEREEMAKRIAELEMQVSDKTRENERLLQDIKKYEKLLSILKDTIFVCFGKYDSRVCAETKFIDNEKASYVDDALNGRYIREWGEQ